MSDNEKKMYEPCCEKLKTGCKDCYKIDMFDNVCHAYRAYNQCVDDFVEFLDNEVFELRHDMESIRNAAKRFKQHE